MTTPVPPATTTYRVPQPAASAPAQVDRLLLRKVVQANELVAMGATASAHAMLTHVLDVAEIQQSLPAALYATALRLWDQTAG